MLMEGIHHVTAITGDAQRNLDFYTRVVGLRMVAKTVNQDDPNVYHLFYGEERGRPGADLTFFEYPSSIPGRAGAGSVHRIVWRVASEEAIDFWETRLAAEKIETQRSAGSLVFSDFEGLGLEIVVSTVSDPPLTADHPEIPVEFALQGFDGVRAYSASPAGTQAVLERLMGATRRDDTTWDVRGESRGGWIALDEPPALPGRQSAGTVHHIAWGIGDDDEQAWIDTLDGAGVPNSGVIDRNYFHSIYFREPGGVLFELATEGPGFTVDGPVEELGRKVILPPWLEPQRAQIVARLTPLPDPRENWPDPVHKA
jgi:glyoxalase family protein